MPARLTPARSHVAALIALLALLVGAAPAAAKVVQPRPMTTAFYWKDAAAESQDTPGGVVTVETPNPFCPAVPGSLGAPEETCAPDRLPVWVRGGDYEEPYMVSAVAFDMTMVTQGSKVKRFVATFLEDERACEDHDDNPQTAPHCRETGPVNIEGQKLQACRVGQIFGGGEARPYKEQPDHICSPSDPVAKRQEIKAVDRNDSDGKDHVWKFDLTPFAKQWAKEFTASTAILLRPVKPKDESNAADNWRVVLAGPKPKKGIRTQLDFTPGKIPTVAIPTTPPTAGDDLSGDSGFGSTSTGSDFGTSSVDTSTPTSTTTTDTTPTTEATEEGEEMSPQALQAAEAPPPVESMPGYVWLGLVAGFVAFSLVRSVVLESAAGIRPNGVLAQIRRLNASRTGGAAVADEATTGPFAGLATGVKWVGEQAGRGLNGLKSLVRRG